MGGQEAEVDLPVGYSIQYIWCHPVVPEFEEGDGGCQWDLPQYQLPLHWLSIELSTVHC